MNGKAVDALSRLVHSTAATRVGRNLVTKMKELLDRQQYEVAIQVGGKGGGGPQKAGGWGGGAAGWGGGGTKSGGLGEEGEGMGELEEKDAAKK